MCFFIFILIRIALGVYSTPIRPSVSVPSSPSPSAPPTPSGSSAALPLDFPDSASTPLRSHPKAFEDTTKFYHHFLWTNQITGYLTIDLPEEFERMSTSCELKRDDVTYTIRMELIESGNFKYLVVVDLNTSRGIGCFPSIKSFYSCTIKAETSQCDEEQTSIPALQLLVSHKRAIQNKEQFDSYDALKKKLR